VSLTPVHIGPLFVAVSGGVGVILTEVIAEAIQIPSEAETVYDPVAPGLTCISIGFWSVDVNTSGPAHV